MALALELLHNLLGSIYFTSTIPSSRLPSTLLFVYLGAQLLLSTKCPLGCGVGLVVLSLGNWDTANLDFWTI